MTPQQAAANPPPSEPLIQQACAQFEQACAKLEQLKKEGDILKRRKQQAQETLVQWMQSKGRMSIQLSPEHDLELQRRSGTKRAIDKGHLDASLSNYLGENGEILMRLAGENRLDPRAWSAEIGQHILNTRPVGEERIYVARRRRKTTTTG